ncbi:MAG: anaerobic ribonucleoside-triphosphate reductase activating protein [Paludibacteraceae bacterium]|nr:anaerobic ribonucleoside-triphosphate reductase activating protein [Paludibacteraceae bacterium]
MNISLLKIEEDTTVDGPGFRTSIYCAGCENACPGCHNPQSWDINNGTPTPVEDILKTVLADPYADVTFTGGDPMFSPEGFTELARLIKQHSGKNIWCYTGYRFEALKDKKPQRELLEQIDVLVDGPFVERLKDKDLLYRGSSNQRLIDVRASLESGETVLYDYQPIPVF